MLGECMCKDFVSFEMIKAIRIGYNNYKLIEDIQKLMEQYNINLPIVGTCEHNKVLVPKKVYND